MSAPNASGTPPALILAPRGRDAAVAAALLSEIGISSTACADLGALGGMLGGDIGFVVVTEDSMRDGDLRGIAAWIGDQPSWSDLPFVVVTDRGGGPERNPAALRLSEALGNVTFVERPFRPTTFASVARTALRGRLRQYEAKLRLEELRESEGRLRTALTAGRLGSWELDLETLTLVASETCRSNFGRGPRESFGYEDLLASVHPDDRVRMRAAGDLSISTGRDYVIEYRAVWPDGSVHWVEVRARVVAGEANGRSRLVGVSADITDRKTAEDDLRRLAETLEERVAERTAELERAHEVVLAEIGNRERVEEQLRQAQKMEMIGQLTGGVAHDFNNLLMAVLANLDLLRKHIPDDPRSIRLIEGALQGAHRGAALTQRLLAFARRQALQVKPTDLGALVRGMTSLLEKSVGAGIEVRMHLSGKPAFALIDANQVELALLNLVVNARDAMPDGGVVTIRVDAPEPDDGLGLPAGGYLRLTVSDSGSGMDSETLRRAVEPFFSTKEVGRGTGLGLSMIHGLTVQLNGALRLESTVGRGTTAELWLPVASAGAETVVAEPPAEAVGDAAKRSTILLVDDDVLIAMSTVDMLEDLGHQVIEVNSGAAALRILEERRDIDLLITDYSMPGMSGAELARAAWGLHPELPILLATGFADLPEGAGIDLPRLEKPYRQHQLAAQIAKLTGVKTAAD